MPTTFLLDPRVLDDCVGDGVKDGEIEAEGIARFKNDVFYNSDFIFYVNFPKGIKIQRSLYDLSLSSITSDRERILTYQHRRIVFEPVDHPFDRPKECSLWIEGLVRRSSVLYVHGKFLKGDAEILKDCGITIKSQ